MYKNLVSCECYVMYDYYLIEQIETNLSDISQIVLRLAT